MKDLEVFLSAEPAVELPADLVPSVMSLVRADLARSRRNVLLALAGSVAALALLAFGFTFFDVVGGALGLAEDTLSWASYARDVAPSAPTLPALQLPPIGYGWAALGLAVLLIAAEARFLSRRATA